MTLQESVPFDLLKMPFDQYGRYKIIAELVDALRVSLGVDRLRILDVGGYQIDERFGERLPLHLFLPDDTIEALDTVESDLPGYHRGDGTQMPFADRSYDLVVSADTLEHIPAELRERFVGELRRVAKHGVALVAPFFSPETELAEIVLQRYMQAELRYQHPFLQEHRDFGLPLVDRTEAWFHSLGCTTATFPSGYVHSWLEMMIVRTLLWRLTSDDSLVGAVEEYYNRVLAPQERREPAYRHLIVAAPADAPLLVDLARTTLAPTIRDAAAPPTGHDQFLQQFLVQLLPMGLLDRLRTSEEGGLDHWRSEAHRVELERRDQEALTQYWEREAHRVELERREQQARAEHWESEAQRVDQEREDWRQKAEHWESEAHRVELERQQIGRERDRYAAHSTRSLLARLLDRLPRRARR